MTPTPLSDVASAPPMTGFWVIMGFIALVVLLFVIGLVTGQVQLTPSKGRQSASRGAMALDAVFSTPERQAAIEYIRNEEHLVELEQERGEGNGRDDDALD